ncbi:hypothetical protein niasHS_011612 [Heterodera schachtii]|uniref:Uncharacterized protein n=1 Tax=Heterodera schachtii TaxID=97005 RepID=A0ABD2IBW5_HETSC
MKRELMEASDTTTTDSTPSSMGYKRQRIHSERMPIKAEQLEGMAATNAQPQNFAVRQQSSGKRRALNRDFATKLASITLTSGELCRLDALFGGAVGTDQLEQFNRAVSGCLCRLGRHAVDQRNDVIALIGAVVGPVDLHQVAFPRRRIFVFQLGYFEFEQIADQKPDLVDYGPWMADMDIQGLPLPSDEFIEQKAQMLQSFLADSAYQQQHFERVSVQRQNVKMEHHNDSSTATVSTTTTSRRTTVANDHGNNSVQQQHQDDAGDDDDEDDDVQVLELATASSKTNMRDMDDSDMDNGRQHQQQKTGDEQLENDEEDDDDRDSEQTKKDVPKAVVTHQPQLQQPNQQTKPLYGETFIREFGQIFICPRDLVRLHELGQSVFDRVAVGLYAKHHMGPWVEQITRVSLGAKPYTMYGQVLTTVLHFEHAQRCTIKALHLFSKQNKTNFIKQHLFKNGDNDISEQEQEKSNAPMRIKFDPPTVDYVRRKSQQLRDTLKKKRTQLANGPPPKT